MKEEFLNIKSKHAISFSYNAYYDNYFPKGAEDIISAAENMRLWVWLRDSGALGPGQKFFSLQRAVFSLHVHLFSLDLKCILSRPFLRLHVWVLRAWGWGEVGDGSSGGARVSRR